MAEPETLIDTCCLVNLCAVDPPELVLPHIPLKWYLAQSVEREPVSVRPHRTAERHERRLVDLEPVIASGVLRRCAPESEEEVDLYVQLAVEVDDGEAMPLAIAAARSWGVATDDAAAIRVATRLGVITLTTPQVVRLWAEHSKLTPERISTAIQRIEELARFVPTARLPGAEWWNQHR